MTLFMPLKIARSNSFTNFALALRLEYYLRHFSIIIIEPTSRQMNRIVYIDIAKAICIILVVIGHYCPPGHPAWWRSVCDFIYSFHMPLFMFASGFVYIATKRAGENYRDFIIKKVKRLMVPYFTVSVIVISIKLLTRDMLMSRIRLLCSPM